MLGDFCLQHELVSRSTLFQKKTGKLWTFRGLGDRYTTIFWCGDAFGIWLRTAKLLIVGASLQIIEW